VREFDSGIQDQLLIGSESTGSDDGDESGRRGFNSLEALGRE
jgi:hypothetical protein